MKSLLKSTISIKNRWKINNKITIKINLMIMMKNILKKEEENNMIKEGNTIEIINITGIITIIIKAIKIIIIKTETTKAINTIIIKTGEKIIKIENIEIEKMMMKGMINMIIETKIKEIIKTIETIETIEIIEIIEIIKIIIEAAEIIIRGIEVTIKEINTRIKGIRKMKDILGKIITIKIIEIK